MHAYPPLSQFVVYLLIFFLEADFALKFTSRISARLIYCKLAKHRLRCRPT